MNSAGYLLFRLLFLTTALCTRSSKIFKNLQDNLENITEFGELPKAVFDIVEGLTTKQIAIAFDNHTSIKGYLHRKLASGPLFIHSLVTKFLKNHIPVVIFNITIVEWQEKYFDYLHYQVRNHLDTTTVFFCTHKLFEHLLIEIYERDYIRRNIIYIFNWGKGAFKRFFIKNIHHVMKVYVITNPKNDTYRLFYNQAVSYKSHHLEKVNWWQHEVGLFNHPTLPSKYNTVYKDFKGKIFNIPVLHKPPWHFVQYNETNIKVLGGRDDRILSVLSKKLNFRYKYFDPPDRIQGSTTPENGTLKGVLGLIWQRQAEFFIGDVALTSERLSYVEFSFITLADSGAFITHAPSKLNEALALLRPFQWEVWPAIIITFMVAGPILYAIIALPNIWHPRFSVRSHLRLFFDCAWFTTTILFRQTGREPNSSHKARFFVIILSISATYVITDMYSANLTSLLARPGREKAINNLVQLEMAMLTRGYNLYVERQSSSYSLLENGTGIYQRLWEMMNREQYHYLLDSVEQGVKLVRDTTNNAVIAGRETLYFDIQRFGPSNFHLSEKLNTAYSAIALQLGCPYIEEINRMYRKTLERLIAIFEAGIMTKMTEYEYEKLGKQKKDSSNGETELITDTKKETRTLKSTKDEKLQPISLKMLQGSFYLLGIGFIFSGIVLFFEIFYHRKRGEFNHLFKSCYYGRYVRKRLWRKMERVRKRVRETYQRIRNDAYVSTLEYLE